MILTNTPLQEDFKKWTPSSVLIILAKATYCTHAKSGRDALPLHA
jgi:hypothetical protein